MRNLKLCGSFNLDDELLQGASNLTLDPHLNEIFAINGKQQLIKLNRSSSSIETLCTIDIFDFSVDSVVSFEFIIEDRVISIIFRSGNVLSFDLSNNTLDAVAKLPEGIDCASWSPDQETAIVTCPGLNKLIVINRSYDVMMEHSLNTSEYGSESLVSVGWGSKQTQFHGSLGKAAREKQETVHQILSTDDRKCRVSWRGDGQFFAVSSIDETINSRVIRIYDRDFILQFTSEVKEGLEHPLAWKPSGEFFVVTQQKFNRHQVSFLEKNGLFFSSFDLPFEFSKIQILELSWSLDSKLLSIVINHVDNHQQSLLIYTYGNGHWYLKQVLNFDREKEKIVSVLWDPIQVSVLHLLTSCNYRQITFAWTTTSSPSSTVAVIDGRDVLITPFEHCVVPPPMCAYSMKFCDFVKDLSFSSNGDLLVQLADSTVHRLTLSPKPGETPAQGVVTISISDTVGPHEEIAKVASYSCVHLGKFDVDSCHLAALSNGFILIQYEQGHSRLMTCVEKVVSNHTAPLRVIAIAPNSPLIELEDGSVQMLNISAADSTGSLTPWLDEKSEKVIFPQVCSSIACVGKLVFGLSPSYTLYCNNQAILKNCCTSYALIDDCFLAYTTTTHHLHIISIIRSNWIKYIEDEVSNPAIPIERGALIVSHCSKTGSIVMQARRGNLEMLYPRTLLWSLAKSLINEKKFLPAFEIMRKHRMDFNLMVDVDINAFMKSMGDFVKQVGGKNVDYLVLFITSLTDESKARPALHENVPEEIRAPEIKCSKKVADICDEMRRIARSINAKYYLDLILVTHIKCNEYEEALWLILELDDSQRDSAFQFIFYFIDVNELYNHALGTYSDEIFEMVASRSQKDPIEYRKLLDDLAKIKLKPYRRFKIDSLLNRPVKALKNLIDCTGSDYKEETLTFIVKNRLFKDALALVHDNDGMKKEIWILYGDYLLAKRYYTEAGIAFSKGDCPAKSMKAYQLSGNWNLALKECHKLADVNALKTLSSTFIHSLTSSGQHIDAALIADRYLNDPEQAVHILVKGHEWNHATRMISQVSRNDDHEKSLTQSLTDNLIDHAHNLSLLVDTERRFLETHRDRLLQVRSEKAKLQYRRENEGDVFNDSMSQISSIRSSSVKSSSAGGSSRSLRTKKSSATREPRQLFKLKQGSRTEDIALVIALKECIARVESIQNELSGLLAHLILNTNDLTIQNSVTNILRSKFISLLDSVKDTIAQVWIENLQETFFIDENIVKIPEDFAAMISKPVFKQTSWDLILLDPSMSKKD